VSRTTIAVLHPSWFRPERVPPLASHSHCFVEGRVVGEDSRNFVPPGILLPTYCAQLRLELGHLGFQHCDSLLQVDGGHQHSLSELRTLHLLCRHGFSWSILGVRLGSASSRTLFWARRTPTLCNTDELMLVYFILRNKLTPITDDGCFPGPGGFAPFLTEVSRRRPS
jgi:hypothetical protein